MLFQLHPEVGSKLVSFHLKWIAVSTQSPAPVLCYFLAQDNLCNFSYYGPCTEHHINL